MMKWAIQDPKFCVMFIWNFRVMLLYDFEELGITPLKIASKERILP